MSRVRSHRLVVMHRNWHVSWSVSRLVQFRFACLPLANAKPHTSHLNGLSPVWSLLWDQSEEYRENVPSQTLQWNGFSAWFWLFCLPPEIERINKILVFLEGPVLQKWYMFVVVLRKNFYERDIQWILFFLLSWHFNICFLLIHPKEG